MVFYGLGYLLRKTGAGEALWRGAFGAAKGTLAGTFWLAKDVALPAAYGLARWSAPHVARAAQTVAKDLYAVGRAAGKAAYKGGRYALKALLSDAPGGRSIDNVFTGKRIRPAVAAAAETAALYWAVGTAPENAVMARSATDVLPMLTRSGNIAPNDVTFSYDPLLGARGGLAFALHRLRHG